MFSRLLRHGCRRSVNAPRAPGPAARVTLRLATGDDDDELARLAALYDRPRPSGPLLLAEVDGELQAALTLTGAQELMEPYLPTAALVELLALRARHLRDQMTPAELAEAGGAIHRDPDAFRRGLSRPHLHERFSDSRAQDWSQRAVVRGTPHARHLPRLARRRRDATKQ
jgi:hypothetical protein